MPVSEPSVGATGWNTWGHNVTTIVNSVETAPARLDALEAASGTVNSVTAANATITVGGTGSNPTVAVGTIAESQVTNLTTDLGAKLAKASNLSDLASTPAARSNLGLAAIAASGSAADLAGGTVPLGRLGASGTANTATFLRGDNTWATPSGSAAAMFTERGLVAASTSYAVGDLVTLLDGKRVVITTATTSSGGSFISAANYVLISWVPQVDIRSYGAVVDGTTDDTIAIQNAINSFSTTGTSVVGTGGIVYFPPGTTRISATLKVPSNVHLRGAGMAASSIQLLPNSNCHMIQTYVSTGSGNSNAFWSSIRDLRLDGRRFNQGVTFTDATITAGSTTITSPSHTFANGEYLQGVGLLPGTTVVSGGGTHTAVMSQAATAAAPQNGAAGSQEIYVGGPWHGIYHTTNPYNSIQSGDNQFDPTHLFQNLWLYFIAGDGIKIEGRSDVRIRDCKVSFAAQNGFSFDFDTQMSGCLTERVEGNGLELPGHSSDTISNCKFYNSYGHGINVWGNASSGEITLSNIDLQQNCLDGLHIDTRATVIAQSITVAQSGFNNNTGTVASGSAGAGVSLAAATKCIIDAAVQGCANGLRITGASSGNDVRVTSQSTVSGAVTVSSDTITLPGSGNRVIVNGVSLTGTVVELTDVALSSLSTGQVLVYNAATGKWNNGAPGVVIHNTQTGTTYTPALADAGKVVEMNNASSNTLTIPANSSVAYPVGTYFFVRQVGAGQTTFAAAGGVTIDSRLGSSVKLTGQWAEATLTKRATDGWVISGELTT